MKKHIDIIERMMFAMANHTVDGKRIYPTLKAAKDALDKQIPKKPIGEYTSYKCPVCGRRVRSGKGSSSRGVDHFCQRCGQAMDWSDTE